MSAYSAAILGTTGLLYYWRLNDASGTTAVDANGAKNGTYSSVTSYSVAGAIANDADTAVTFGSGYVSVTSVSLSNTFTLSGWYKPSGSTVWGLWGGTVSGSIDCYIKPADKKVYLDSYAIVNLCFSSSAVDTTSWWNIVITRTSSAARPILYINGANVTTNAGTGTLVTSTTVYAGAFNGSSNLYLGDMDEICWFDNALSADKILYLYNVGKGIIGNDQRSKPARRLNAVTRAAVF